MVLLVKQKKKEAIVTSSNIVDNNIFYLILKLQNKFNSKIGIGIIGFWERTETLDFEGSCTADHLQNQHFRSNQNKALEAETSNKKENPRFNNNS